MKRKKENQVKLNLLKAESEIPSRPPGKGWTKEELEAHGKQVVEALKAGLKKAGVK